MVLFSQTREIIIQFLSFCLSKLVLKYPRSQPLPISFMVSIIYVEAGQLDTSMSLLISGNNYQNSQIFVSLIWSLTVLCHPGLLLKAQSSYMVNTSWEHLVWVEISEDDSSLVGHLSHTMMWRFCF